MAILLVGLNFDPFP